MIHLDTHIILWLYEGLLNKFPTFAQHQLKENELMISPIVQLEVQYLYEIKRITKNSNLIINELTDKIALKICEEPLHKIIPTAIQLHWTRDPFDRLIVATAQITNTELLTKDANIAAHYKHTIWE